MISMTYDMPREAFRFAMRNELSFWPFFGFFQTERNGSGGSVSSAPANQS
jgi:hypothetical protein